LSQDEKEREREREKKKKLLPPRNKIFLEIDSRADLSVDIAT